jgi:hypothetical protein
MEILRSTLPGGAAKSRLARLSLADVLCSHLVQGRLKTPHDEEQVRHAQRDFVSGSQHGKAHFVTPFDYQSITRVRSRPWCARFISLVPKFGREDTRFRKNLITKIALAEKFLVKSPRQAWLFGRWVLEPPL